MITFEQGTTRFHCRVAGVAIANGKVLLCRSSGGQRPWFLPGGRAELLESSDESLRRELREELDVEATVDRLLWIVENFFDLDGRRVHELCMIYLVDLPADAPVMDQERVFHFHDGGTDTICQWHDIAGLSDMMVFPVLLRHSLLNLPESPRRVVVRDDVLSEQYNGSLAG